MFVIGRWQFATKEAARRRCKGILDRHQPGHILRGEDDEFLRALIDKHDSRQLIVGCGIHHVFIQQVRDALDRPWKRFVAYHTDDSWRQFAWKHAIYPRSQRRRLASVLRELTASALRAFKDAHLTDICVTCQAPLARKACHVDHAAPSFDQLMDGWLKTVGLAVDEIEIVSSPNYEESPILVDPFLAQQWIEYHEIHARLRCVCRRCNLSTLRRLPQETP